MPSSSNVHNIFASFREAGATTPPTPQVVDEIAMCSDEEDNMAVEEEEVDVDSGELVEMFEGALTHFKEEVVRRIHDDPKSYSKCVKSFAKQVTRSIVTNCNHSVLEKTLFTFLSEETLPAKKGRRKSVRNIPIQKASESRRLYKFRGTQNSRKGRPKKDIVKPKSVELSYHCLPKQKPRKRKNPHSISAAVLANRAAGKNH